MTISAIAPMTGSYNHLQVAPSVLLAVPASCAEFDLAGRLHSPLILIDIFCMNCWSLATPRATHWQEVVC